MVVTEEYIITFRRDIENDILESRLYKKRDANYHCIGICQSGPAETERHKPPKFWKTAFIYNGYPAADCMILNQDAKNSDETHEYTTVKDKDIGQQIGSIFVTTVKGGQVIVKFQDGMDYPADLDESFTDESLCPEPPEIREENIGECLKLWNMGIREEIIDINNIPTFIGITINTSRHMYIFEMTPDSIYCRAARFAATNKGVVFNQNFRQGGEAYMIEDNTEARLPLPFDESLFSNASCVWNERSVYWSVASYSDNEIMLHGCQGDIYRWKKPVHIAK